MKNFSLFMPLWESDLPLTDIKRYSRQIILPFVKIGGQKRIDVASVLIIGMGGLGAPVLTYLASAGISKIGLVDFDVVELHNLQRQVIYKESQVGRYKTSCAKEYATEMNPTVIIEEYNEMCTKENIFDLIKDYDIIADCCDNIETRYLINDACRIMNKSLVSASVLRWEGQVFVIPKDSACYRCMFPEMKREAPNCSASGVMGPVCGLVGSMQANEIIKLIISLPNTLLENKNSEMKTNLGNIIVFNSIENSCKTIKKNFKMCAVCETKKMGEIFSKPCKIGEAPTSNGSTKVLSWNHIIANRSRYKIVDIRSKEHYRMFRVADSISMPNIEEHMDIINSFYKPIVVSCYKGVSSIKMAKMLNDHGIEAFSAQDGIEGFKNYVGFYEL